MFHLIYLIYVLKIMRVTKRKTLLILGSWFCFFLKKLIDNIDDFK